MSKNVYANGNEISAKKDGNKSIAAMPDVCLSPPSPPAGPIPIPYPNTSDASKTSGGSKNVKIGGKEIGLKNKSCYKSSNGDEAATKSFGMGVVSHNIQGPSKHAAWSMDVKIEGKNAIRHMDLMTHNHSNPAEIAIALCQGSENEESEVEPDCPSLKNENNNVQENDLTDGAKEKGDFTVTTASYTPTGGGINCVLMMAVTPQPYIRSGVSNAFAQPRPSGQTMACNPNEEWGDGGSNNHTEPKIIEQIFEAAGNPATLGLPGSLGKLKMNISRDVCPRCQKGICEAVKCGLDIVLCEGDPPTEVDARKKCDSGEFQSL